MPALRLEPFSFPRRAKPAGISSIAAQFHRVARYRAMRTALALCLLTVGTLSAAPDFAPVRQDVEAALAAARARAVAGDVVAQFSLGSVLYYGSNETAQAVEWFRKAAAQDYAAAEFQMGQLYDFGFGVGQSDKDALAWYRKAAEHGNAAAQRTMGDFYRKGRAVAADAAEAARWYLLAADGDDIRAQYQLGDAYLTGNGVARDYVSAYVWFALAAGQAPLEDNRKQLIELRNIAAARLTPENVVEAARRVAAWRPPASRGK
jgi:TPR repeat protein